MRKKTVKRRNRKLKEPFLKRSRRAAIKVLKFIIAVCTAAALWYGGIWSYRFITTTQYLAVKTIDVTGAVRVAKDDAVELSGIEKGENIFSFSASDAAAGVLQDPWVKGVRIKRRLPDTVEIAVTERQPLALVKMDDLYVMDTSGAVFKRYSNEDDLDLPVVTGLKKDGEGPGGALEAALFKLIGTLRGRSGFNLANVSEFHIDDVFGISVYTVADGVRLEFGFDNFDEKLASLEKVLKARGGVLRGVEAMDLNGDNGVIVRFNVNVVKEGGAHGKKG